MTFDKSGQDTSLNVRVGVQVAQHGVTWFHLCILHMEGSQVWAQLGDAPAPGDHLPPAQRQPGLRGRQEPAL